MRREELSAISNQAGEGRIELLTILEMMRNRCFAADIRLSLRIGCKGLAQQHDSEYDATYTSTHTRGTPAA